jgi:BNR repeat-like domain
MSPSLTRLQALASGTAAVAGSCVLGALCAGGCQMDTAKSAPVADRSLIAQFPGRASSPSFDARNVLHVTYIVGEGHAARVADRVIAERTAEPVMISPPGDAVEARGEDGPVLATLPEGTLLVVYSVSRPGGSHHHGANMLQAQVSRDGRTWSAPRAVNDDTTSRSHAFVDVTATRSGGAVVAWLDSRSGSQGVQTAVVRADGAVTPTRTADEKTCQCCRTALHSAGDGTVWLAYRDLAPGDVRDMAYAVSRDGGQTFMPRGDVAGDGWSLNGCPESGPRFAETADGTVWLAWFNGKANAIEVASARAGGPFGRPSVVASGDAVTQLVNHPEIGTLADGRLVVFYEAFRDGKRAINARVSDAGHERWSPPIPIADDGRAPRYARSGDRLRLTYTRFAGETAEVRLIDPRPRLPSP